MRLKITKSEIKVLEDLALQRVSYPDEVNDKLVAAKKLALLYRSLADAWETIEGDMERSVLDRKLQK